VTRPTARGVGLLVVALVTYLAARLLGTWELYLLAFAFVAALLVAATLLLTAGRAGTLIAQVGVQLPHARDVWRSGRGRLALRVDRDDERGRRGRARQQTNRAVHRPWPPLPRRC